MNSSPGLRTLAVTTLLALALTGAAGADSGNSDKDGKERKVIEKHRIVINENGRERVIEGDGPMVRRGFLGVSLTELTPELRTHFGVPEDAGVMVSKVEPGSPAEKAGLKVGDIISAVDGKAIRSSWDVGARVRDYEEGQQAPLEIWRNGKVQTVTASITLKERPEMEMGPMFIKTGEGGGDVLLHLDPEAGGPGHKKIRMMVKDGMLKDGEMPHKMISLRTPREMELEKKLQILEKRLDELEAQLKQKK
jgi:hypothetical protein